MNNNFDEFDFTRTLPISLRDDETITNLAKLISDELHDVNEKAKEGIIYARIDELPENIIDILAYDLHVDWYDPNYSIDEKRATIKDSVKVHKYLGTKYAVETALGNIFPGSRVEEWFEYGGEPYMFKIIVNVSETDAPEEKVTKALELVRFYKNLRSKIDSISYEVEKNTTTFIGVYTALGINIDVFPEEV